MGTLQISKYHILIALFLLLNHAIAQNDTENGFNGGERNALLALKAEFDNPFLNDNWTSIMCFENDQPDWYGIQCLDGRVTGLSLESLGLTGKINSNALFNLTELLVLSFRNNSISGNLMDFTNNQKLKQIDLSTNKFEGPISDSLLGLNSLESLLLQDNNLNGSIPAFKQSSLRQFDVSNNKLSGSVPQTKILQSFSSSSFSGNLELCGPPSLTSCGNYNDLPMSSINGSSESRFAAILIVVNVVGIVVIAFLFCIYYKKTRKLKEMIKRSMHMNNVEEDKVDEKADLKEKRAIEGEDRGKLIFREDQEVSFELNELLKASAEGLGKGNFGNCYKAMLESGVAVCVKRLRDLKPLTSDEFAKQVMMIGDLKHPNLLPLLAHYYSKDEKLLVYKVASNGNVFNRLHDGKGKKGRIPFRWATRISVAGGVARALEYLHLNTTKSSPQATVPHGNLKSTNVLLDENDAVLVSDYALTSLIAHPIAAQRMASFKSPEFQNYKKVSKKSDVWSYGCFLLELVTGKVSVHSAPQASSSVDLSSWVHRAVREEWTAEIFDVEISAQRGANHGMLKMLRLALRCCDKSPEKRPEMGDVAREIENMKVIDSSEDEDDFSVSRSFTDDSMTATPLAMIGEDDQET